MHTRPIIIGITGGIGSGKTTICNHLRDLGYLVYESDSEAHRLIQTSAQVRQQLISLFGPDVYLDGKYNRSLVSQVVFTDKSLLQQLNAIIHPAVKADFQTWLMQHSAPRVVFIESAILFESGFSELCHATVLVTAPDSLRIERTMARDGATAHQVQLRIASQTPVDSPAPLATLTLCNDGHATVSSLVHSILELADEL